MSRFVYRMAMAAALAAGFAAIPACGQTASVLTVEIPFSFKAAGQTFAAGQYHFRDAGNQSNALRLEADSGRSAVVLPVITSLGRAGENDNHVLVFDKVGEEKVLSEVWMPGRDGLLVTATRGEHQHEIIRLVPESISKRR